MSLLLIGGKPLILPGGPLRLAPQVAPPPPPLSGTIVNNASELLAAASVGGSVVLAPVNFGDINITGVTPTTPLTVTGQAGALLTNLHIRDCENMTFVSVEVGNPDVGGDQSEIVFIRGDCDNIEIRGCDIHGPLVPGSTDPADYQGHRGISINGDGSRCTNIRVLESSIHHVKNGGLAFSSDVVEFSRNTFDYLGEDCMKFGSATALTIHGNYGIEHHYPDSEAHSDFCQLQGVVDGVDFRHNALLTHTTGRCQFFFADDAKHDNIHVENNLCITNSGQGVWVIWLTSDTAVARNNTLLNLVGGAGSTYVRLLGSNVTSENNVQTQKVGKLNTNLTIQHFKGPGDDFWMGDYFDISKVVLGATIDDLRPLPGVDLGGMGVDYDLLIANQPS